MAQHTAPSQGGPEGHPPRRRPGSGPIVVITPVTLWLASPALTKVIVHWHKGRTEPCRYATLGEQECPGCEAGASARTQFWVMVQDFGLVYAPRLTCLTPHAVDRCPALVEDGGLLWGRRLRLYRTRPAASAALWARLVPYEGAPPPIWPCPDAMFLLRRMWAAPLRDAPQPGRPRIHRPDAPPDLAGGLDDLPL